VKGANATAPYAKTAGKLVVENHLEIAVGVAAAAAAVATAPVTAPVAAAAAAMTVTGCCGPTVTIWSGPTCDSLGWLWRFGLAPP